MRRPFKYDTRVYLQVVNKEIQRFNNKHGADVQDEMYLLPETANIQAVTRAIDDFDYLVHSYDPQSDEIISDYLDVRNALVGYRIALYSEFFSHSF